MDINDIRNAARKTSVDESSYYLDWYYGLRDAIETIDAHYPSLNLLGKRGTSIRAEKYYAKDGDWFKSTRYYKIFTYGDPKLVQLRLEEREISGWQIWNVRLRWNEGSNLCERELQLDRREHVVMWNNEDLTRNAFEKAKNLAASIVAIAEQKGLRPVRPTGQRSVLEDKRNNR